MNAPLPAELTQGAMLRDQEYAWELADFPQALLRAPSLGYACLGGEFWFFSGTSLYEPFWLEANASDKVADEEWTAYARRSCEEVLDRFNWHLRETDFREAAGKFSTSEVKQAPDLHWMFNAYFVTEREFQSLNSGRAMSSDKNTGRPMAIDPFAISASNSSPAFIARPPDAPVYHGFQVLDDVVVDGFTLGIITAFEEGGATDGDAFVIAPDNSRAGLVWTVSDNPQAKQTLDQVCPMEKSRWGVWELLFPYPMANHDDARRNLQAVLPMLKPKWEEWRQTFGTK